MKELLIGFLGKGTGRPTHFRFTGPRPTSFTPEAADQSNGQRSMLVSIAAGLLVIGFSFLELEGCAQATDVVRDFEFSKSEVSNMDGALVRCVSPMPGQAELKRLDPACVPLTADPENLDGALDGS